MTARIVVLDYGSGNLRSAQRALERVGAYVTVTADLDAAGEADGLVVPGVGAFAACMAGIGALGAADVIRARAAQERPVLGICVGMQVMFDGSTEPSADTQPGLRRWPGTVERLRADVVPHMGWSPVEPPAHSRLFAGIADQLFYFVHSYAARSWSERPGATPASVTWCEHGTRFVAAVEDGPLVATQFSQMTRWSFHYLVSLGLSIINTTALVSVFKLRTQEGAYCLVPCLRFMCPDVLLSSLSR